MDRFYPYFVRRIKQNQGDGKSIGNTERQCSERISDMGVIRIKDQTGRDHEVEAVEGWRIMEIIREHGFDVGGLCGGACACATCHVEVSDTWSDKLHPAREDEEAMLDELPLVHPGSRLSCQIIYTPDLDGLAVRLVDGA